MYHYNRISDDSLSDLQQMQRLCYGSAHSINEFQNKYDTEVFGLKNIGFIAKDENGDNAAFYGVFPITINYESKSYLAAQSGDTMTVPEHRKKGLFVALAKDAYQLAREKGVKIVFGFPNQNSYPGFKNKLDWKFNGYMQKFTIVSKVVPWCELSYKAKFLRGWFDSSVQKRMKKYAIDLSPDFYRDFNYSVAKGFVQKDEHFFSYKLRNKNVFLVNVDGFAMLVKVSDHLHIGEIGRFDMTKIDSLLVAIKKLSRKVGCKKAIITISQSHWLYPSLIAKVNCEQSLPIGFYTYDDAFDIDSFQFCHADYDTF
jgi:GNAT superfamily N-acetyltransferase